MICWHKWRKWSAPLDLIRTTYLHGDVLRREIVGQSRECEKCGKIQLRRIGSK